MGTYCVLALKRKNEDHTKWVNELLEKEKLCKSKTFNGVKYGYFVTEEQLREDARYMNEDPQGIHQSPGLERPVTPETLSQFPWLVPAQAQIKLSGSEPREIRQLLKIATFLKTHGFLDLDRSDNYNSAIIKKYLPSRGTRKHLGEVK